jgi:uncharacterized protein (TIGR02145 family)
MKNFIKENYFKLMIGASMLMVSFGIMTYAISKVVPLGGGSSNEGTSSIEAESSSKGTTTTNEVIIGKQVWMTRNLNVNKFRNGDPIPEAKTDEEWLKAGENEQPAWCYYDNDLANGEKYGKLYNWYAVNDRRGLAPKGWKIPSDEDWSRLTDFLGGENIAGKKLKFNDFWAKNYRETGNGTNESEFSGLPGGCRLTKFMDISFYGRWWSSTKSEGNTLLMRPNYLVPSNYYSWSRTMYFDNNLFFKCESHKRVGYSVRCLKD